MAIGPGGDDPLPHLLPGRFIVHPFLDPFRELVGTPQDPGDALAGAEVGGDFFLGHDPSNPIEDNRASAENRLAGGTGARAGHHAGNRLEQLAHPMVVRERTHLETRPLPQPIANVTDRFLLAPAQGHYLGIDAGPLEDPQGPHVIVGTVRASAEHHSEAVRVEVELVPEVTPPLLLRERGPVKRGIEEEPSHPVAAVRHPEVGRGIAGFFNRSNEEVGPGIDPVAAKAIAVAQLPAIGGQAQVGIASMGFGQLEKSVIEVGMGAHNDIGATFPNHLNETFRSPDLAGMIVQAGVLQEVEVEVVQFWPELLDAVVKVYPETIDPMGHLQGLVNGDFGLEGSPLLRFGPSLEGAGAHIVPSPGAGGKHQNLDWPVRWRGHDGSAQEAASFPMWGGGQSPFFLRSFFNFGRWSAATI